MQSGEKHLRLTVALCRFHTDLRVHDPGLLKPDVYPLSVVDLKAVRLRALEAFRR